MNQPDLDKLIKKYSPTKKAKKLRDVIFTMYNSKEFVLMMLYRLNTEEKRKRMLDFINEYNVTDSDKVAFASHYIEEDLEFELEDLEFENLEFEAYEEEDARE